MMYFFLIYYHMTNSNIYIPVSKSRNIILSGGVKTKDVLAF